MSKLGPALILMLVLIGGCAQKAPAPAKAVAPAPAIVCERVVDGDTIVIRYPDGRRDRVRLRNVDAFEISPGPRLDRQAAKAGMDVGEALQAGLLQRADLQRLLDGRAVRVTPYARDRYGRLIADVELVP